MIVVTIPKYADGRAFSIARLLRERDGYQGEIRAIGDYIVDQVPFMLRVGIDAFQTEDPTLIRAFETGVLARGHPLPPAGLRQPPRSPRRHAAVDEEAGRLILPRKAGEGDRAKHGGGGERRLGFALRR